MFVTESLTDAGMDSIGFLMRKHVIVVTVKDKNELHVYNAMNGKLKNSIKVEQNKSIWWIPRHSEMMKGVGNCEKLRRVEHKH